MRHGGRRRGRPRFLLLGEPFHGAGGPYGWDGLRFAAPLGRLHALARELVEAPAVHSRIEHFQGSAAGIDLVVMGEIGKPSRTRNSSSFHEPRRIFTLPARHCELNGPNLVSLSPLSGAGVTVKPLSARTRWKAWVLPACPGSLPKRWGAGCGNAARPVLCGGAQ